MNSSIVGPSITKLFANKFQMQIEDENVVINELDAYNNFKLPKMVIKKSCTLVNINSPGD